jgi:ABC-type bacteriocin/lantibiotic exporter with double-glycine peptidase domain
MKVALWIIKSISKRRKGQLALFALSSLLLSFIELIGVSLLVLSLLNGTGPTSSTIFITIHKIAPDFVLSNLLLSGCILLLFRSIGTAVISSLNFRSLSKIQESIAKKISYKFLSMKSNSSDSTSFSFAVNDGVNAATVGLLGLSAALFNEYLYIVMLCTAFFFVGGSTIFISTLILLFFFGTVTVYFGKLISTSSKDFALSTMSAREKSNNLYALAPQILFTTNLRFVLHQFSEKRAKAGRKFSQAQSLMQMSKSTLEISFLALVLLLFVFSGLEIETSKSQSLSLGTIMIFGIRLLPALLKAQSAIMSLRSIIPVANSLEPIVSGPIFRQMSQKRVEQKSVEDFKTFEAKDLGFRYESEKDFLFSSISFQLSSSDFLLIKGESGKGKTTLAKILAGLETPNRGQVTVNDHELEKWREDNLNAIAYCPQTPFMLNSTIRENILLSRSSDESVGTELSELVKICKLEKLLQSSRLGYETVIMGKDLQPSGGEIQRIGLARALALQPSLLILDEPTSALDQETEFEIFSNLKSLSKTVILISHSDQANLFATKILNLD